MTDIAALGLAVDSRPVSQASTELTKFADSAKTAESAAKRWVDRIYPASHCHQQR